MAETGGRRRAFANRARSLRNTRPGLRKARSDRSSSCSTDTSEKILNIDLNENVDDMFIEVCNTFEVLLQELNLSENSHRIQDKLMKIGSLIEKKLSLSQESSSPRQERAGSSMNDLSQRNGRSRLSESTNDSGKEGESRHKKFMKEVNCPFCSEIQSDKFGFVKHLDKSCSVHLKKDFKKAAHIPYSTFQILPNNLIKCNVCNNQVAENLLHFYDHTQSQTHRCSLKKVSKTRDYDNRLFCVVCKALVYNTYTQIRGHIDQEAHKQRCELKKTTADFLRSGIHFLFTQACKFKCLSCPPPNTVFNTSKSALKHLDDPNHKKHIQNAFSVPAIYCEVCDEEVWLYKIITHFSSNGHSVKEKSLREESFEVCFCCNFFCKSLLELSYHMESECVEINNLRKKMPKESQQGKEGNVTNGSSIIVKNCTRIPALFRYFTQFGEIVAIQKLNDQEVVIEFRGKSAVDDVFLLQDVIVVDGTKLMIVADTSAKSVEMPEVGSESEVSKNSSNSEDDADLDSDAPAIQGGRLDELFARVSNYLMNTAQKLNSHEKVIIQQACVQTLKAENCHFVGFSGCELSFPSETTNLFCEFSKNPLHVSSACASAETPQILEKNLLKMSHTRLLYSDLWQNPNYSIAKGLFPVLECVHRDTQKACRFFMSESARLLTDMLRECMEKSELVKPLCLIIRFWLSVHELRIKDFEFALIALLVFFVISGNVVALSEEKYKNATKAWFYSLSNEQVFPASSWDLRLVVCVKELFQKFLQFMNSFDLDKYVICLPLRCPIPRSAFIRLASQFPTGTKNTDKFKSSSICILDPVSCDNLAHDIDRQHREEFLKVVAATIRHYKIK